MMVTSDRPPANRFVRYARKVYNPIGFTKGYNFILFFIFGLGFFAFCLSRTPYMNFRRYCTRQTAPVGDNDLTPGASPGECYYYTKYHIENVGIQLHLYCVIPAGMLAVLQFIPVIRHKLLLVHRLNGYLTMILGILGAIGGLMIARHAFGGTLDTQSGSGAVFILCMVSLFLAYVNVKRLQIDQHRAWMLRAWAYFATILTVRLTMKAIARIVTDTGDYYTVEPCDKLLYTLFDYPSVLLELYPGCQSFVNGTNPEQHVVVKSSLDSFSPAEIASALGIGFGTCVWISIFVHAIGVELYLHLTPRESRRLRDVSYQRQLEAGYSNPGNGGLTVQRFGDADPFVPSPSVVAPLKQDTNSITDSDSALDEKATEHKPSQLARPEARTVASGSSSE